ncbi:MAG: EI24 domain-containing protein [Opitutaceae bacterium]
MNAIKDTKFAFGKAHEIIWEHGHWKYLLVPIVLTALLLPALGVIMISLSYFLAALIEGSFTGGEEVTWIRYVVMAALLTGAIGTGYVLYRNLVMVCYGPFLDRLSVQAEILVNGAAQESNRPLLESLVRPLVITAYAVAASFSTIIIGLLLGLIPLIGGPLMLLFLVPTQLFLGAVGYVDPYLERKGYSARESLRMMRHYFYPMLAFAILGSLLLLIPFVGWFIAPTYSAVAGIVFAILMTAEEVEPVTPPK